MTLFPLYATWALLPTLIARARLLAGPASRLVCVLLIAAVCALQDDAINKDRETYALLIQAAADNDMLAMEPGFFALVKLLDAFFSGSMLQLMFFFVVAALSLALKFQLFRRYGGSLFGCLAAFFSYFFLVHEITQVRIGFAIGLLYLAWFSYAEGRHRDFLVFGVLASLFHFSCLVFVAAPVLFPPGHRTRRALALAVVSAMAATSVLASGQVLTLLEAAATVAGVERVGVYFELLRNGVLADISPVRLLPHTALLLVAALHHRAWRRDTTTTFVFRIYLYGLLLFLVFWPIPAMAYRLSDLFLFAGVFLVGRLRRCLRPSLYYPFVLAYTGVFVIYTVQFSGLFLSPS
jgi:hypothetical protein